MTIHEFFDIDKWRLQFPVELIRQSYSRPGGKHITSPVDIAIIEMLRKNRTELNAANHTVPTDLFAFGYGEPGNPACTKVGGVPYRSKRMPWPKQNDKNFTFVAQFNFSDSHDIVGPTPSDILLVFALKEDFCDLYFEWSGSPITDLTSANIVPVPGFNIPACFAQRYRTFDIVARRSARTHGVAAYLATKIGGIPSYYGGETAVDSDAESLNGSITALEKVFHGRYICTLGPIQVNPHFSYPWVNHPERIGINSYCDQEISMRLVDLGCLYIGLASDGAVTHLFQPNV